MTDEDCAYHESAMQTVEEDYVHLLPLSDLVLNTRLCALREQMVHNRLNISLLHHLDGPAIVQRIADASKRWHTLNREAGAIEAILQDRSIRKAVQEPILDGGTTT